MGDGASESIRLFGLGGCVAPYVNQYAKVDPSSYVIDVAPKGTARWTNRSTSIRPLCEGRDRRQLDHDQSRRLRRLGGRQFSQAGRIHGAAGSAYNGRTQIVNRGGVDGGGAVSDTRLTGVLLRFSARTEPTFFFARRWRMTRLFGETLTFTMAVRVLRGLSLFD